MPTDPKQELLVALAGPAVNVVLAGLLFDILTTIGWAAGSVEELSAQLSTFSGNLLVQLFAANLFLAVFNLSPAFPLDGGRVFRAILAMKLDYVRATQVGIRGVLWNQGEADGDKTAIYDDLMATMVADWRKHWGHEFPFYFVQMPARKEDASLVSMWQAQTRALVKIPHSGMIVCNDISEPGTRFEVHPRDKRSVGERLARLALVRTYGVKGIVDSSPMMQSVTRDGNRVTITFSTPGEGLKTRDGQPSDSWELAGPNGKFVTAKAELNGAKVIVTAAGVDSPTAVRLGWKSDSNCNLTNSAGLPAMPFTAMVP
jgi:hypothetical protein